MNTGSSSNRRMVTAFFDSRSDAEQAIERLSEAGVSRDSIRFMPGDERDPSDNDVGTTTRTEPRGFWDSLGDWFLPDEDRGTYAEGLSRGGYLLSVEATDAQYERVLDILDDEGTIDIDERAQSWRSEGWTGGTTGLGRDDVLSGSTANLTTGDAGITSDMAVGAGTGMGAGSTTSVPPVSPESRMTDFDADGSTRSDRTVDVTSTGGAGLTGTDARLTDRGEEVIPVAEERLRVGKRDVSHGRVRIRSYVVETPVEEQVTLREERVAVERRPADRALSDADQAFQERTIEAEERGEEVVVRKEAEQRTETVSDTVRQTEVEVEDERGNTISGTGTTDRT
jgi:stress response protein YsnF